MMQIYFVFSCHIAAKAQACDQTIAILVLGCDKLTPIRLLFCKSKRSLLSLQTGLVFDIFMSTVSDLTETANHLDGIGILLYIYNLT